MVSADDIPLVMTSLSERLNFRAGDTQTANTGQVQTGLGAIDLEQIFEVIDTLDNANYTFLVDDEDEDIYTFTNLIVKKREDGSIDPPYLLRYTVDSLHRDEFLESNLSMEHFTGMISKRFLTNFSSQQESSANLGGEYDATTTEPCDYDSGATGGGDEIGWTDPFPPADGGPTGGGFIRCEFVTLAEEVTTCYRSDIGDGPRCTTVTQYVTKTHCYWVGPSQDVYDVTNCPDPETEEVGVIVSDDVRIEMIRELIKRDPFLFMDINCDQIRDWQKLVQHKPPVSVMDKIRILDEERTSVLRGDWQVQHIEDADGPLINLDYFPVKIERLPKNPNTGEIYTPEEFFSFVRKNLNSFFENNSTQFGPYSRSEELLWESPSFLGAIMRFDINLIPGIASQDGTVICSKQEDKSWIFTTIESRRDWNHPVSGNRQFGLEEGQDGSYTFYTRGTDRIAEVFDVSVGSIYFVPSAFDGADKLWSTFQLNLVNFINDSQNGGRAAVQEPIISRPTWSKVEAVLKGERPISDLGCK